MSNDTNNENKNPKLDSEKDEKQNSVKRNICGTEVDAVSRDSSSKSKVNETAIADKESERNKIKIIPSIFSCSNKTRKINENKKRNNEYVEIC